MAFVRHVIGGVWAALLLSITGVAWAATSLQVEAFDVEQVAQIAAGARLNFSVFGTPGAAAAVQIDGALQALELREVEPGVYEGTYTVAERDRIAPDGRVVATLRRGGEAATAVLAEPLRLGASPRVAAALPPPALPEQRACDDCAVVESIRAVEIDGSRGYAGAVVGGLLGAMLGDQIGRGDGRRTARFAGAVGGVLIGREIERRHGTRTQYDVVLRRPGGASQVRRYDSMPAFKVGDTVKLGPGVR